MKLVALGLGFKYVWHAGGRFLARRKGGERAHVFATAADLHAIEASSRSTSTQHRPNMCDTNSDVGNNAIIVRQEAAPTIRSAQSA